MAKYVWYKVINNNLVVLKDDLGRIHYCSTCPCINDKYKLFVDIIEIQPYFNAHIAAAMPNPAGAYDTHLTFNYYDSSDIAQHPTMKPYIFTFQDWDFFHYRNRIYQQTVSLDVSRAAKIDLFK